MIRTVEAVIEKNGAVHLLEEVDLPNARRALVTILEEEPTPQVNEAALLSQDALAKDWSCPEEDDAWSYLQQDR